jgi:HEAT repeat protein
VSDRRLEDKPTFEKLLADLKADDPSVRSEAAEALGKLRNPRAVEPLIQALGDPESQVCNSAIVALGELGDLRAVGPLMDLLARNPYRLTDSNLNQPVLIARALARLGEAGFRALLRMLREYVEHEFVGTPAAQMLGEFGDVRAIDTLILALHSSVYEVAHAAAWELRSLGEPALVPLAQTLRAEHSMTGFHAMQALGWIGTSAVPLLLEVLRDEQHSNARCHAGQALGNIGDERA